MAFYTGICNSFADMKSALIGHCQSNGWTATTDSSGKDVIYKGNLYVMLDVTTGSFNSFGITGRTGVNEGSAPGGVGISDFYYGGDPCPGPVQFPVRYFCFTYSDIDEIYFLINYADKYQWIAFGKSNIVLPGTGLWVAGTSGLNPANRPETVTISASNSSYRQIIYECTPAMFWYNMNATDQYSSVCPHRNCWIHSNLRPSYPWSLSYDNFYNNKPVGILYLTTHLRSQPNQSNQQSLLLPILAYNISNRHSGYYELVASIQKARHIMINYIEPETIIYHGSEQWMIFPWLRKVYQSPYTFHLKRVDHTGNFGWAIKKEA